jgi:hypothetical protein
MTDTQVKDAGAVTAEKEVKANDVTANKTDEKAVEAHVVAGEAHVGAAEAHVEAAKEHKEEAVVAGK